MVTRSYPGNVMERMTQLARRAKFRLACVLAAAAVAGALSMAATAEPRHAAAAPVHHVVTGGTSSVAVVGFVLQPAPRLQQIDLAAVAPTPIGSAPAPEAQQAAVIDDMGGPVQTAPRIYVVFVGNDWLDSAGKPTSDAERTLTFFADVAGSAYDAGLQQYRGAGTDPKLVAAWVDPVSNGATVDPAGDVAHVVQQEKIPGGTDTQVVAVYPPGYTFATPTESGVGAYHAVSAGVPYAAISYAADLSNSLTQMLSHEYAETITDPLVTGDGSVAAAPAFVATGAVRNNYNELADLCGSQTGDSPLAAYFDQRSSRCITPPLS